MCMWNKKNQNKTGILSKEISEGGFSLIEVVIAIVVLTIGLLGAAAALTYALQFTNTSRNVSKAKAIIVSTIEEVESLRNTRRLDFKQIANVGNVDNTDSKRTFSGFSVGFKPVSINPGADGVNGTEDDLIGQGTDGIYGTEDDVNDPNLIRGGYSRQVTITPFPADPTIKKVEVKVTYVSATGGISEITGVSYVNDESRTTG